MGSSVKLVTKDELTTGNYFNADNLIGGENTTIVKDGDVYKINSVGGSSFRFISEYDTAIGVGGDATYINIGGGANQIITIGTADTVSSNVSTAVWTDDFIIHTFGNGGPNSGNIKLYGNITDKNDNEIFGLTSDNAGDNITITGSGSTLKINAAATVSYPHITDSDNVTISVNGSSNTFAFTADNISSLNTLIASRESYLTQNVADGRYAGKTELNYKQDQLTSDNAGNNITITGSGSTLKINAEATASYPHITDSDNVIISVEGTSDTFSFTSGNISALNTLVSNSGNYLTQSAADGRYAKTADLSNKQDQLTSDNAGDNITITGSGSTLKINAADAPSYPHITDSDKVTISVNGSGNTFAFTADNISSLNTLVSNSGNYLTQSTADERYAQTSDLSNKQDQLTSDNAGDNITITGSGSALKINAAAAQYESGDGISIENNIISIGDNGITSDKIADGAITTDKIANGSIIGDKIADGTITGDKIIDGAITADKITDGSITSDKIVNGAITADKLSNNSITPEKIKLYPTDVNSAEISYFQNFNVEFGINDRENSVLIGRKLIKYVANSGQTAPPIQILSDAVSSFNIYYDFYSDNTVKIYGSISFKINKTFNANTSIRIPCLTMFSLNGEQIYIPGVNVDAYANWYTGTSRPSCRQYLLSSQIAYPDETGYDDYFALFVYNNSNVNFNTAQGTGAFNSLDISFSASAKWKKI